MREREDKMGVTVKIFICCCFLLIACCCCTVGQPQMVSDCCLSVKNKTISQHVIVEGRRQIAGQGCSIDATILVTRQNRKLCVPADEPWVEEVMRHVSRRKRCGGKRKNRCGRVKKNVA